MVRGARGEAVLSHILVDTGASYTVLPEDVVERVGAWLLPHRVALELGDGRVVEANVYAVIVGIEDRIAATIAVSFKGARVVVGVRTLEDLGLKVDPIIGRLEPTRPRNTAYFYATSYRGLRSAKILKT